MPYTWMTEFFPTQEACVQVFIATEIEHKQHHIWGKHEK